jgi:hypothetical protein
VPEVAGCCDPAGSFAFNHHSPIESICWPLGPTRSAIAWPRLLRLHQVEDGEDVWFQLPYAEWIRLFGQWLRRRRTSSSRGPAPDATSSYRSPAELAWARRWPAERSGGCVG